MKKSQENRVALRLITAVTLFLFAASSHAAVGKMPRGAYLRYPAPTAAALCAQVKSDPLVMERYSRLFRMTPPLVRGAFAKLRLSRMKADQISRVYYVHPNEKLGYRLRRVKKGTLVFVLPDGSPALVQICGNPMRADLKYKHSTIVEASHIIKDFSPEDMDEARAAGPMETDESMDAAQTADAGGTGGIGAGEGRAAAPDSEWSGPGGSDVGFTADAADIAPGFVPSAGGIGGAAGGGGLGGLGGAALTGLAGLTAWVAGNGGGSGNYQPSGSGSPVSGAGGSSGSGSGGSGGGSGSGGFGGGGSGGGGGNGSGSGNNGGYTSVVPESDAMTLLIFALLGIGLTQIAVWHRARRQSATKGV